MDYCPVCFFDPVFPDLMTKPSCCFRCPGKEHYTRHRSIQPMYKSDINPSRFIILPLVMLLTIASIRKQQLVKIFTQSKTTKALTIIALFQMAFSLRGHSKTWRIKDLEEAFSYRVPNFSIQIIDKQHMFYQMCVNISFVISLTALIVLLVWWIIIKQKRV